MRTRTRLTVLLAAATVGSATVLAMATGPASADVGPLQIISYDNGLCLGVADASTDDGTEILQSLCHRNAHQLWHFRFDPFGSPYFQILPHHTYNARTPSCLTVRASDPPHEPLRVDPGLLTAALLNQYQLDLAQSSLYQVDPAQLGPYQPAHVNPVPSIGDTDLEQHRCGANGVGSQLWSLVPNGASALPTPGAQHRYRFINASTGQCLEARDSAGDIIEPAPCDGSLDQLWIVVS